MEHKIIGRRLLKEFDKIVFDEPSHTYKVRGTGLTPVSTMIKNWYIGFDAMTQSIYSGRKHNKTPEEMRKEWKAIADEACEMGTMVHDFGERYVIDRYGVDSRLSFKDVYQHKKKGELLSAKELALVKFWNEKPDYLVPICLELRMFSEELKMAGTADIIFLDTRDNSIVIGDYKTNKDLHKRHKEQMMVKDFDFLPDTPLSHYEIQLSLYQLMLEKVGYKVSRRFLIWLLPDETYQVIDTQDWTEKLNEYFYRIKSGKQTVDGWATEEQWEI
jgi:hypothetical protein